MRSGNSGGPVVDAAGHVLTTVFAQRAGTDGGFGVPTTIVRSAIERGRNHGAPDSLRRPLSFPCTGRGEESE